MHKNPTGSDRKWPKIPSLVKFQFLTDFELLFGRVFLDFWKMLHQYFILDTPQTFFLVYTGCGSAIYNTQFHFRTLYIPKNHSDMEKIGHFKKSKKKFFQKKFSKKIFQKNFAKKNFWSNFFGIWQILRLWALIMSYSRLETTCWWVKSQPEITWSVQNDLFLKTGHFQSFPATSGPVFLHQIIVSSL